jgi:hypothetical protein
MRRFKTFSKYLVLPVEYIFYECHYIDTHIHIYTQIEICSIQKCICQNSINLKPQKPYTHIYVRKQQIIQAISKRDHSGNVATKKIALQKAIYLSQRTYKVLTYLDRVLLEGGFPV